ncbi:hypothetical protein C8035_v009849 [Colletotrichum spinosum]|uniref:Uncharacterized protein n=1 Tax=Colletotrichum spinosum TaxID=1347390 RepID=A0A4R8PR67_9PEZI|nr:hypothetical protein C8035_v009849 [Colletotrichum spinosum]
MSPPYQTPYCEEVPDEDDVGTTYRGDLQTDGHDLSDPEPAVETRKHELPNRGEARASAAAAAAPRRLGRTSRKQFNGTYADPNGMDPRYTRQPPGQGVAQNQRRPQQRPVNPNPNPNPFGPTSSSDARMPPPSGAVDAQQNPFAPRPSNQYVPAPPYMYPEAMDGNPFSPRAVHPSPVQNPPPSPFPPHVPPPGWLGYPSGPYPGHASFPGPQPISYAHPSPYGVAAGALPPMASPYAGGRYPEEPVPAPPRSNPRYDAPARRPSARPVQPRMRPPSREEMDMEHFYRDLEEIESREQERVRQDSARSRAQQSTERQAARMEDLNYLRSIMEQQFRAGFDELRQNMEMYQAENRSESGFLPAGAGYANRRYSTPARSVHDERAYIEDRRREPPDAHQRELDQFRQPNMGRLGDTYRELLEFDRRSNISSRAGTEQVQRAIQAARGLEVALRDLDIADPGGYGFAPGPASQRPPSDLYYDEDVRLPSRPGPSAASRSGERYSYQGSQGHRRTRPAPAPRATTEADWLGRPRPRRSRTRVEHEEDEEEEEDDDDLEPPPAPAPGRARRHTMAPAPNARVPSRAAHRSSFHMSGGRGPTYQDVGLNDSALLGGPANHPGFRRHYDAEPRAEYFEEEERDVWSDEESIGTQSAGGSHGAQRFWPPPAVPEPPCR